MALEQIHVEGFCILGVQTKFILQNKSMARAIAPPPASNTVFSPVLDFLANLFSWRFPLSWRCQDILFWRTARPEVSAAPLWKLFFLVAVFLGELLSKKKKIIVHVNNEKQECFQASLAGLPPCIKALGYFLRCIKRVHRQYVIGSLREERE